MHRFRGKPACLDAKPPVLQEGEGKEMVFKSRSFSALQVVLERDCKGFMTA